MSSNLPYKQVKNVERRTWNKQEYLERAESRAKTTSKEDKSARKATKRQLSDLAVALTDGYEKEEFMPAEAGAAGPLNSQRSFLRARKDRVDLDSKLGSIEILNPEAIPSLKDSITASANGIGWHCSICDCWLRDSITYVDHINGRKHQKYLGYSMRTGKSSNEQVKNKLAALAKETKQSQGDNIKSKGTISEDSYMNHLVEDNYMKERNSFDEEPVLRRVATDHDTSHKNDFYNSDESGYEEEVDSQNIAAIMGFSGFK